MIYGTPRMKRVSLQMMKKLEGMRITGSPALVVFQGKLHLFYQISGADNMQHAVYDGNTWSKPEALLVDDGIWYTTGSPALAVFQGKLHLMNQGLRSDGSLWHAIYDGKTWSKYGAGGGISDSPALAVFQGKLHLLCRGSNDNQMWHAAYDGKIWSRFLHLKGKSSEYSIIGSPALAVFNNTLYCISEGGGGDGWLWITKYDGKTWSRHEIMTHSALSRFGTTDGPGLIDYDNRLFCFHQGQSKSGWLWYTAYGFGNPTFSRITHCSGNTDEPEVSQLSLEKTAKEKETNEIHYPVGWMPYLADWVRYIKDGGPIFRYYDPVKVPGVGLLLTVHKGNIYGEEFLSKHCAPLTLYPKSAGHYSWVLVPYSTNFSRIIYVWNSKLSLDNRSYTRHSDLAGGDRVICAGEFYLSKQGGTVFLKELHIEINDASGHYKPNGARCLGFVVNKFKDLGLDISQIQVSTFNES